MRKLRQIWYCMKLVLEAKYIGESFLEECGKKSKVLIFDNRNKGIERRANGNTNTIWSQLS